MRKEQTLAVLLVAQKSTKTVLLSAELKNITAQILGKQKRRPSTPRLTGKNIRAKNRRQKK
jgi:hypothetical protein